MFQKVVCACDFSYCNSGTSLTPWGAHLLQWGSSQSPLKDEVQRGSSQTPSQWGSSQIPPSKCGVTFFIQYSFQVLLGFWCSRSLVCYCLVFILSYHVWSQWANVKTNLL